jgi:hypothetical protein
MTFIKLYTQNLFLSLSLHLFLPFLLHFINSLCSFRYSFFTSYKLDLNVLNTGDFMTIKIIVEMKIKFNFFSCHKTDFNVSIGFFHVVFDCVVCCVLIFSRHFYSSSLDFFILFVWLDFNFLLVVA